MNSMDPTQKDEERQQVNTVAEPPTFKSGEDPTGGPGGQFDDTNVNSDLRLDEIRMERSTNQLKQERLTNAVSIICGIQIMLFVGFGVSYKLYPELLFIELIPVAVASVFYLANAASFFWLLRLKTATAPWRGLFISGSILLVTPLAYWLLMDRIAL